MRIFPASVLSSIRKGIFFMLIAEKECPIPSIFPPQGTTVDAAMVFFDRNAPNGALVLAVLAAGPIPRLDLSDPSHPLDPSEAQPLFPDCPHFDPMGVFWAHISFPFVTQVPSLQEKFA